VTRHKMAVLSLVALAVLVAAAAAQGSSSSSAQGNSGTSHGNGNGQFCGFYFPPSMPRANVIARTPMDIDPINGGLTVSYFAKVEYAQKLAGNEKMVPLSTVWDIVNSNTNAFSDNIVKFTEETDVPVNEWVHIVQTWKAADGRTNLYVDGILHRIGFYQPNVDIEGVVNDFMVLGQKLNSEDEACDSGKDFSERFIGYIAHFNFWNHILPEDQLEDLLKGLTDLSSFPDIPQDLDFLRPFEVKEGAESFLYDCPDCFNKTTPTEHEDCGKQLWGYRSWDMDEYDYSASKWTTTCDPAVTPLQSPVDILLPTLADGGSDSVRQKLNGKWAGETSTTHRLVNDKHHARIIWDARTYGFHEFEQDLHLREVRFNWPSEHIVNGDRVPLEAQIIFESGVWNSGNRQVIFAILFRLGENTPNPWIANLVSSFDLIRQPIEIPSSHPVPPLNLGLLADIISMHSFAYSYSGRSTSPPCRDNVQYYVLDSPANKIDKDQMSAIHRLLRCHPDEDLRFNPYMWGNYRHTTPYQQGHVRYVEWH